jgi:hypothetical protein
LLSALPVAGASAGLAASAGAAAGAAAAGAGAASAFFSSGLLQAAIPTANNIDTSTVDSFILSP